ncbi:MAG: hypothetical protein QOE43_1058 [Gaiellaceae bacterium]|jgi:hypothetical protein|nr:hypothetical protein [Gaiellaceae bacterium]
MGWQERDWARQPDDGAQMSLRQVVWIVVGALVLAVAGYAWTQLPHRTVPPYGVAPTQPDVIYGQPTEQAGILGVCTEYEVAAGAWRCNVVDLNSSHLRVARAEPYDGPCTHMSVDQTTGRWVCISVRPAGTPPVPAGQNS